VKLRDNLRDLEEKASKVINGVGLVSFTAFASENERKLPSGTTISPLITKYKSILFRTSDLNSTYFNFLNNFRSSPTSFSSSYRQENVSTSISSYRQENVYTEFSSSYQQGNLPSTSKSSSFKKPLLEPKSFNGHDQKEFRSVAPTQNIIDETYSFGIGPTLKSSEKLSNSPNKVNNQFIFFEAKNLMLIIYFFRSLLSTVMAGSLEMFRTMEKMHIFWGKILNFPKPSLICLGRSLESTTSDRIRY